MRVISRRIGFYVITAIAGRPVLALAAFATVQAAPGEAVQARMTVPARAFARYRAERAAWVWPPGQFTVLAGRSSRNLRLSAPVFARWRAGLMPLAGREPCPRLAS